MLTIAPTNRQYLESPEAYVNSVYKGSEGISLAEKKYTKRTVRIDADGGEDYGMKVKKPL